MEYVESVLDLIGGTPILKISHFPFSSGVKIFAKLEYCNPGGSVKDRMAKWIIARAEAEGKLKQGYTILEATAGNTGIGIALAAINRGYEVIFVVPGKFSIEKQVIIRALGAKIVNTPTELGLKGAFAKIEELKAELKTTFVIDQFANPLNPDAHYRTTGPEIYRQLDGQIDYFVAGAGSGGTFSGVMRFLKEKIPHVQGILVDPVGSIMGGGICNAYNIEGIGNDFIPETMDLGLVDQVIKVTDNQAFQMVRALAKQEGVLVGSSSGAAFYGAWQLAQTAKSGNIVTVFADRADRYLSKDIFGTKTEEAYDGI